MGMKYENLVLEIIGFMSNGEVAIETSVVGEPEQAFNCLVYGLVSSIRKIVSDDTIVEDVPHSSWAINEYRKEYLQAIFKTTFEILRDEEQPLRVEEIPIDEEGED